MANVQATRTLVDVDRTYEQLGCLGHGGFGSVFLARKRSSGRWVALKIMPIDEEDKDRFGTFQRELDAVVKLNNNPVDGDDERSDNRDLSIIYFHEWFVSRGCGFACIVMNFVDGGTLQQEIVVRSSADPFVPYAERRIAWYVLQLTEALLYAHERGIAYHDVKSANVLIDWSGGGRLVLADFGTSVVPGEESVGFSPLYAAPELMAAYQQDDLSGLRADLVDAFGLGCILFELLACQPMNRLPESQTLAWMVSSRAGGVDTVLNFPWMRLPWLPEDDCNASNGTTMVVGYSHATKNLARALLDPSPNGRWTPLQLVGPLRNDPNCPLMRGHLVAAETPISGHPVTVDNIQLGMFVQRGSDWEEEELDGGAGSIGVIIKLDADAGYTEVAWPHFDPATGEVHSSCYRIGASRKHEILVGPTLLPDFYAGSDKLLNSGFLTSGNAAKYSVGQVVNENCVVVGVEPQRGFIFVAPRAKIAINCVPIPAAGPPAINFAPPREPQGVPDNWDPSHGLLVEVMDVQERKDVCDLLFSPALGVSVRRYEVTSVRRVQSNPLWLSYAQTRESIANENWGITNERRLFHGTSKTKPDAIVTDPVGFDPRFCDGGAWGRGSYFSADASYSHEFAHKPSHGVFQLFLARVALGKTFESKRDKNIRRPPPNHHSVSGIGTIKNSVTGVTGTISVIYETRTQALPEYLITYRQRASHSSYVASSQGSGSVDQTRNFQHLAQIVPFAMGTRGGNAAAPRRRRIVRARRPRP